MPYYDEDSGFKHRNTWKHLWLKYQFSIISWFALVILVLIAYHGVSDGDFSFLMTLGSLFVCFSFILLCIKVAVTRKVSNISLKTLECYALVFAARLCSILFYEGYLPYDKSGDWFYQATEVSALVMVLGLLACVTMIYNASYGRGADKFGAPGIPSELGIVVLVGPALVLAILLHPNLNNNWFTDSAWAFALYLEAVAMLPQLVMFQNARNMEVEPFEANFVFSIAVARMLHFVFWLSSYHELNDKYSDGIGRRYPGHLFVLSQVVNLLLMGDYCYYYILSAKDKKGFILPQTI